MATDQLIREIQRVTPFDINSAGRSGIDVAVMQWIGSAGQLAPAYYIGQARDIWLRNFVLKSDHLKIAVNTFIEKVLAIPLDITPRDATVKAHVALARQIEDDIQRNSGMLKGFQNELSKFINDYLTTDNGGFMMLLGPGKKDGPIVGQVVALLHLDSCRCFRTGNVEFPVTYEHTDGKRYEIHYTRIIFMSSMPSADSALCDVGLCAVSRSIDAAQELFDMMVYSQEKLGSRPPRQILYAKKGATLQQLVSAVQHAENKMDAQGLTRFARTLLIAPQTPTADLELDLIDLSSLPDNFNRMDATMLDMAILAASFGLDLRDLAFSFGISGHTKADAQVQDNKTKGKGAAQFMRDFAIQFEEKVLPESLQAEFDYVDDTQDNQAATMDKTRAETRTVNLASGAITLAIARQKMVDDGELSPEQFEQLELEDGRLSDGMDLLTLFMSTDPEISRVLNLGVDDPTNVDANDATAILMAIDAQSKAAWQRYDTAPNINIRSKMRRALAALDKLQELYQPVQQPTLPSQPAMGTMQPADQKPAISNAQQPAVKAITKEDNELDALVTDYTAQIDEATTAAVNGETDKKTFKRTMEAIIAALLLAAFLRGSKTASAQDLTRGQRLKLNAMITISTEAAGSFADDIYSGKYAQENLGQDGIDNRIPLWAGTLAGVYAMGQVSRVDNPRLQWQVGPTEHCSDCAGFNGQIKTAAAWNSGGLLPQSSGLQCHGYRCQCRLVEV